MTTEHDYQITPRPLTSGGGWQLQLLENGKEVSTILFSLPAYLDLTDEKARQTLLDCLYEDALAEGTAWLANY